MSKNGLFLLSIGCLILMFSVNTVTAAYDVLSMITALTMILTGVVITFKGNKQKKAGGKWKFTEN